MGSGISLLAAGIDARVKAVAAMSFWGNLTRSLFPFESPAINTVSLLVTTAELLGHPSPELLQMYNDLLQYKNISSLSAFGAKRSPFTFIDNINRRNVPVFLSANFGDTFFPPEVNLQFFSALTCPKMILMNQGGHAEPEAFGLFDVPHNYIWTRAKEWFDYWLKGKPTGILDQPRVQFESGNTLFSGNYQGFNDWPPTANGSLAYVPFYFQTRGSNQFGGLSRTPQSEFFSGIRHRKNVNGPTPLDNIHFSFLPTLSAGTLITDYTEGLGIPDIAELAASNPQTSIVYMSAAQSQDITICGTPVINITVTPNSESWQIYGYLYSVDPLLDTGRLITYGPYSRFLEKNAPGTPQKISNWELRTLCTVVPAGHKIALGFTLYEAYFEQGSNSTSYNVDLQYDGATLVLPMILQ
jgi:hypothetical protein